jgi:uncharacterized protein
MIHDQRLFPWGDNRRFNSYAQHCIRTYGTRMQKLSIDAGFTCPNRDGSLSTEGCTFCSNEAFNPSYCNPLKTVTRQIEEGISFHRTRYRRAAKYIAYFQAYSNTYAPLEKLKAVYGEALSHPAISGISIGTRPDCIDDDLLDYLQHQSSNHFISIEYGIESCYDRTLKKVNRQHTFAQSVMAIQRTAERQIQTGVHLILGLPGESTEDILQEARIISDLPVASIKLHQLQILKGTKMERQYREQTEEFHLLLLDEYIDLVIGFLEMLRPSLFIERLTSEVPPRFLAGPGWGLIRSDQVMQRIEKIMAERNTWQGKKHF